MPRVFLLSPANCGGARGRLIVSERAAFPLAEQLRTPDGAELGDLFSFMSGLYFRGKLAYARAFAQPPLAPSEGAGVLVITSGAGLQRPDTRITLAALLALGTVDVRPDNGAYRGPLEASARELERAIGRACEVVLLGSIASPKYVDILTGIFGERLVFPSDFVGRGDMSRGGLLLRCVAEARELPYVPVIGAVRHGARPPKLTPLRSWSS